MPSIPRFTYHSVGLANMRYQGLRLLVGDDHPATLAARGRYFALRGDVPQRTSAPTPDVIAWHRETAAIPGYLNRRARKGV